MLYDVKVRRERESVAAMLQGDEGREAREESYEVRSCRSCRGSRRTSTSHSWDGNRPQCRVRLCSDTITSRCISAIPCAVHVLPEAHDTLCLQSHPVQKTNFQYNDLVLGAS